MRYLVLCHEGAPMAVDTFATSLRKIILDHPADDADLWSVWEVPPVGSMQPSRDITAQFAKTWAIECEFGRGTEPDQYLAPIPAFVLEHARDELIRIWQRRRAQHEPDFMPAVLASARVAA
jgi:hypothetical protein